MITLATMGKYWYIEEYSGGGSVGFGGDEDNKRKPALSIGSITTEDFGAFFKILKIEEEEI